MNVSIIGANYGDEGKGRTVDFLASNLKNENPLVIRHSGSNNASHTVYLNEKRHAFSCLGSGTLRDVPTYLSKFYYLDIISLKLEIQKINKDFNKQPTVYIDPRCKLILPYDVVLNRLKEYYSGNNKHGSTGNGFNEAIKRNEYFSLNISEYLKDNSKISEAKKYFLNIISEKYSNYSSEVKNEELKFLVETFVNQSVYDLISILNYNIGSLQSSIKIPNLSEFSCIFEGSQGLLLDQYYGNFPYVTHSNTGNMNVISICQENNIKLDELYYVTRPYLTRHGFDPYFNDKSEEVKKYFNIKDETNIFNPYQDEMKYNFLDIGNIIERIKVDVKLVNKQLYNLKWKENINLMVTCCDQLIENNFPFYNFDTLEELKKSTCDVETLVKISTLNDYFKIKCFYSREN